MGQQPLTARAEAAVTAACSSARGFPAVKGGFPPTRPPSASTLVNPSEPCGGPLVLPKEGYAGATTIHSLPAARAAEETGGLKAPQASPPLPLLPHAAASPSLEACPRPNGSGVGAPASMDWVADPIDSKGSQRPGVTATAPALRLLALASSSASPDMCRPESGASLGSAGGGSYGLGSGSVGGGGGSKGVKFSIYHRAGSGCASYLPSRGRPSPGDRATTDSDASSIRPEAGIGSHSSLLHDHVGPSVHLSGSSFEASAKTTAARNSQQQGSMVPPLAWSTSRLRADSGTLDRHASSLLGPWGGLRQSSDPPPPCELRLPPGGPPPRRPSIIPRGPVSASQITQLLGGDDTLMRAGGLAVAASADTNIVFGAPGSEGGSGVGGELLSSTSGGGGGQTFPAPLQAAAVIRRGSSAYAPIRIEDLVAAGGVVQRKQQQVGRQREVVRTSPRPDTILKMLAQPSDEVGRKIAAKSRFEPMGGPGCRHNRV